MATRSTRDTDYRLLFVHGGSLLVRCDNRMLLVPDTFGLLEPASMQRREQLTPGAVVRDLLLRPRALPSELADVVVVSPSDLALSLTMHAAQLPAASNERQHAQAVIVDLLKPAPSAYELRLPTDSRLLRAAEAVLLDPVAQHLKSRGADLAGLSVGKFTQLFTTETGIFWTDWCFAVRMYRAMRLLNEGLTVGEVAHLAGYKTPSSFNTAFTGFFGVTPGASKPHTVCKWCGHVKLRRTPTADRDSMNAR